MKHHSADDFLPVAVHVADRAERTDGSVDQRRAEQVLERPVLELDRVDGVRQRHWAPRTEAVEEGGGGAWRGGVMSSQLDRRRRQLAVDEQSCQAPTTEPVVRARHFTRRCTVNRYRLLPPLITGR